MQDDLTAKVNLWLDQTGYPLEMRVEQKFQVHLSREWDQEPNRHYRDPDSDEERETDLYLDHFYDDDEMFTAFFRIVIECKSTSQPWVVFKRADISEGTSSFFDPFANRSCYWERSPGQLNDFLAALEKHMRGRVHALPAPGYVIAEAFKSASGRDSAYNAARQVLSAAAGIMDGRNIWGEDVEVPACSTIASVIVTASPLFEATLKSDGSSVTATPVTWTAVQIRRPKETRESRVIVMNEQHVDDLIADCKAFEHHLVEFMAIVNPELLRSGGDKPFELRTTWR